MDDEGRDYGEQEVGEEEEDGTEEENGYRNMKMEWERSCKIGRVGTLKRAK